MNGRPALVAMLLVPAAVAGCREEEEPKEYGLVWQDEFDGPAGRLPDPAEWEFDKGTGWGNRQLDWDTDIHGPGHYAGGAISRKHTIGQRGTTSASTRSPWNGMRAPSPGSSTAATTTRPRPRTCGPARPGSPTIPSTSS